MWTTFWRRHLLLVLLAVFGGCDAACEIPPDDHPFVKAGHDCKQTHGKNPLCWVHCFAQKIGIVDANGDVHEEKMDAAINELAEGEAKEAAIFTKKKCFKKGLKIDVTQNGCTGYIKVGRCMLKQMKARCPELVKKYNV